MLRRTVWILLLERHMLRRRSVAFFTIHPVNKLLPIKFFRFNARRREDGCIAGMTFQAAGGDRSVEDRLVRVAGTVRPLVRRCEPGDRQLKELVVLPGEK